MAVLQNVTAVTFFRGHREQLAIRVCPIVTTPKDWLRFYNDRSMYSISNTRYSPSENVPPERLISIPYSDTSDLPPTVSAIIGVSTAELGTLSIRRANPRYRQALVPLLHPCSDARMVQFQGCIRAIGSTLHHNFSSQDRRSVHVPARDRALHKKIQSVNYFCNITILISSTIKNRNHLATWLRLSVTRP